MSGPEAMKALADEQFEDMVLEAMHATLGTAAIKQLTFQKWRDGIDIERATHSVILFAREILRAAVLRASGMGRRDREAIAQILFKRTCERAAARGQTPHHAPGTLVTKMPPSYRDDYLADADAILSLPATVDDRNDKHAQPRKMCKRCQGNGEIVVNWDSYLHPTDRAAEESSVAECPDCSGEGFQDDRDDKVREALEEGSEILVNLAESIRKHGNYTPKTTITFIDNALQCLRAALQSQSVEGK